MATENEIRRGLEAAKKGWLGASYEPDPRNGCCWAATIIASYYSPWAAGEYKKGVVYVPTLCAHARQKCMYEEYAGSFEMGDILVYGDEDHVVVSSGGYRYIGNSTSRRMIVEGDWRYMGLELTGIIKTSRQ